MRELHSDRRHLLIVVAALLAIGVLALDFATPPGAMPSMLYVLVVLLGLFGPLLHMAKWDTVYEDFLGSGPGTGGHILGTTMDGYDMLAGLVNGAKISASVSFVAVLFGGSIGSFIGITSAYYRGKFDTIVTGVFNVMLSIPNLVLSLALLSVLAYSDADHPATTSRRVLVLMLSLTIVIIPILGRIARASTLQWSGREFVIASKSMGTRNFTIIRKHILPNVAPAILAIGFALALTRN